MIRFVIFLIFFFLVVVGVAAMVMIRASNNRKQVTQQKRNSIDSEAELDRFMEALEKATSQEEIDRLTKELDDFGRVRHVYGGHPPVAHKEITSKKMEDGVVGQITASTLSAGFITAGTMSAGTIIGPAYQEFIMYDSALHAYIIKTVDDEGNVTTTQVSAEWVDRYLL